MAYTIYGKVKFVDENGVCQGNAGGWVRPYFKKIDPDSFDSKWTDNPYQIDQVNEGYYGFDVEDYDLLGPDSDYRKGSDKFYIAYFYDANNLNNTDKDSATITHAAFVEHTFVSGEDLAEINVTLRPVNGPKITTSSLPSSVEVNTHNTVNMSETSELNEDWYTETGCDGGAYIGSEASQQYLYDSETIFGSHTIKDSVYEWGETQAIVNKTGAGTTNNSHTYTTAGSYNVGITVRNTWGGETTVTKALNVKYNQPDTDFSWDLSNIAGGDTVTFTNNTTDLDSRADSVYTYEWIINDGANTQTYTGMSKSFQPTHIFQSSGTKSIVLRTHWNDGFDDLIDEETKQLTVEEASISVNFEWDKVAKTRGDLVTLTNTSTGAISNITQVDWTIEDNYPAPTADHYTFSALDSSKFGQGSPDNTQRIDNTYSITDDASPSIYFHSNEEKTITMTVHYDTGFEIQQLQTSKTYQPETYLVDPLLTVSDSSPLGRDTLVNISNGTSDPNSLQYDIDLVINDYYSENNLDNPNLGSITDNTDTYNSHNPVISATHKYQNSNSNIINLTIRYDDGWQRVEKTIDRIVTPSVYSSPSVNFTWTPGNPIPDRNTLVTFMDSSIDTENRHIASTWIVNDFYALYNPDNPNYGASVTDNSITFDREPKVYEPSHKFQADSLHTVVLQYFYDDGFEETVAQIEKTIVTILSSVTANFTESIVDNHLGEVTYTNTSDDPNNKVVQVDWTFNDRDGLNGNSDHIVTFVDQETLDYKWQYAPRRPRSTTDNPALNENKNKTVEMTVRFDDGWEDNKELSTSKTYTAITNEIDFSVVYLDIISNSQTIYGTNDVEFRITIDDSDNAYINDSIYWTIDDFGTETNKNDAYAPIVSFASAGQKDIITGLTFDDGYGNSYIREETIRINVLKYLEPILRISYSVLDKPDEQIITYTQNHESESPYGTISQLEVDYKNDGTIDLIDMNGDGIGDQQTIVDSDIFYQRFAPKQNQTSTRIIAKWWDGFDEHTVQTIVDIVLESVQSDIYGDRTKRRLEILRYVGDESKECLVDDIQKRYFIEYATNTLRSLHPNHYIFNNAIREVEDDSIEYVKTDDEMYQFFINKELIIVPIKWVTDEGLLFSDKVLNDTVDYQLNAISEYGDIEYTLHSGAMPPGLTISNDGIISGTILNYGDYYFTIRASDEKGVIDRIFRIFVENQSVFWITPSGQLNSFIQYEDIDIDLLAEDPEDRALTYALTTGTLPDGLSLDYNTGKISGTTAQVGNYQFVVNVSDGETNSERLFSLEIISAITWVTDSNLGTIEDIAYVEFPIEATSVYGGLVIEPAVNLSNYFRFNNNTIKGAADSVLEPTDVSFILKATDSNGNTSTKEFYVTVTDSGREFTDIKVNSFWGDNGIKVLSTECPLCGLDHSGEYVPLSDEHGYYFICPTNELKVYFAFYIEGLEHTSSICIVTYADENGLVDTLVKCPVCGGMHTDIPIQTSDDGFFYFTCPSNDEPVYSVYNYEVIFETDYMCQAQYVDENGLTSLLDTCPVCGEIHTDLQVQLYEDIGYYVVCPTSGQSIFLTWS